MPKTKETMVKMEVSDGTQMSAYMARPEAGAKAGLLVFQEAFGVNHHIMNITRRLAEEGYVCLAPELFHRTAPVGFEGDYNNFPALKPHFDALNDEALLADTRACHEWLQKEAGLKPENIGAIGFCMGGKVAFLANAKIPLGAMVSFYGSRILTSIGLSQEQRAPLLLLWAGQDSSAPPEKIQELHTALRSAGKPFIQAEFSQAQHGFNCDERPAYHPDSAAVAWAMTLAFLKRNLAR
jgi:carboxymethylenebutenolidase